MVPSGQVVYFGWLERSALFGSATGILLGCPIFASTNNDSLLRIPTSNNPNPNWVPGNAVEDLAVKDRLFKFANLGNPSWSELETWFGMTPGSFNPVDPNNAAYLQAVLLAWAADLAPYIIAQQGPRGPL